MISEYENKVVSLKSKAPDKTQATFIKISIASNPYITITSLLIHSRRIQIKKLDNEN